MLSAPPAMTTRSMPAMMLGRRGLDRGHARRAVAVVREAGDVDHPELDRGVAGDVAAALEHLAEDDVVDVVDRDARALQRLGHGELAEVEGVVVDERALAGRADGGPGGGDDDGVTHGRALPWSDRCPDGGQGGPPAGRKKTGRQERSPVPEGPAGAVVTP